MHVRFMVTNHGPHPADLWAQETAASLVDVIEIAPDSPRRGELQLAKDELELKLRRAMMAHHEKVQKHERGKIEEHGLDRLKHPLDPGEHVENLAAEVIAAAKGTMFEKHFAKSEVQLFVRSTLASHFGSAMDIERSWHADRNIHTDEAKAYHYARAKHGAGVVHAYHHYYMPPDGKGAGELHHEVTGKPAPAAPAAS